MLAGDYFNHSLVAAVADGIENNERITMFSDLCLVKRREIISSSKFQHYNGMLLDRLKTSGFNVNDTDKPALLINPTKHKIDIKNKRSAGVLFPKDLSLNTLTSANVSVLHDSMNSNKRDRVCADTLQLLLSHESSSTLNVLFGDYVAKFNTRWDGYIGKSEAILSAGGVPHSLITCDNNHLFFVTDQGRSLLDKHCKGVGYTEDFCLTRDGCKTMLKYFNKAPVDIDDLTNVRLIEVLSKCVKYTLFSNVRNQIDFVLTGFEHCPHYVEFGHIVRPFFTQLLDDSAKELPDKLPEDMEKLVREANPMKDVTSEEVGQSKQQKFFENNSHISSNLNGVATSLSTRYRYNIFIGKLLDRLKKCFFASVDIVRQTRIKSMLTKGIEKGVRPCIYSVKELKAKGGVSSMLSQGVTDLATDNNIFEFLKPSDVKQISVMQTYFASVLPVNHLMPGDSIRRLQGRQYDLNLILNLNTCMLYARQNVPCLFAFGYCCLLAALMHRDRVVVKCTALETLRDIVDYINGSVNVIRVPIDLDTTVSYGDLFFIPGKVDNVKGVVSRGFMPTNKGLNPWYRINTYKAPFLTWSHFIKLFIENDYCKVNNPLLIGLSIINHSAVPNELAKKNASPYGDYVNNPAPSAIFTLHHDAVSSNRHFFEECRFIKYEDNEYSLVHDYAIDGADDSSSTAITPTRVTKLDKVVKMSWQFQDYEKPDLPDDYLGDLVKSSVDVPLELSFLFAVQNIAKGFIPPTDMVQTSNKHFRLTELPTLTEDDLNEIRDNEILRECSVTPERYARMFEEYRSTKTEECAKFILNGMMPDLSECMNRINVILRTTSAGTTGSEFTINAAIQDGGREYRANIKNKSIVFLALYERASALRNALDMFINKISYRTQVGRQRREINVVALSLLIYSHAFVERLKYNLIHECEVMNMTNCLVYLGDQSHAAYSKMTGLFMSAITDFEDDDVITFGADCTSMDLYNSLSILQLVQKLWDANIADCSVQYYEVDGQLIAGNKLLARLLSNNHLNISSFDRREIAVICNELDISVGMQYQISLKSGVLNTTEYNSTPGLIYCSGPILSSERFLKYMYMTGDDVYLIVSKKTYKAYIQLLSKNGKMYGLKANPEVSTISKFLQIYFGERGICQKPGVNLREKDNILPYGESYSLLRLQGGRILSRDSAFVTQMLSFMQGCIFRCGSGDFYLPLGWFDSEVKGPLTLVTSCLYNPTAKKCEQNKLVAKLTEKLTSGSLSLENIGLKVDGADVKIPDVAISKLIGDDNYIKLKQLRESGDARRRAIVDTYSRIKLVTNTAANQIISKVGERDNSMGFLDYSALVTSITALQNGVSNECFKVSAVTTSSMYPHTMKLLGTMDFVVAGMISVAVNTADIQITSHKGKITTYNRRVFFTSNDIDHVMFALFGFYTMPLFEDLFRVEGKGELTDGSALNGILSGDFLSLSEDEYVALLGGGGDARKGSRFYRRFTSDSGSVIRDLELSLAARENGYKMSTNFDYINLNMIATYYVTRKIGYKESYILAMMTVNAIRDYVWPILSGITSESIGKFKVPIIVHPIAFHGGLEYLT